MDKLKKIQDLEVKTALLRCECQESKKLTLQEKENIKAGIREVGRELSAVTGVSQVGNRIEEELERKTRKTKVQLEKIIEKIDKQLAAVSEKVKLQQENGGKNEERNKKYENR